MTRKSLGLLSALLAAVMVVLLLVPGCGTSSTTTKKATGEPYKVGVVISTSGPNAPLGTPEQQALNMLQKQLNEKGGIKGRPIEFTIIDDASDPAKAKTATTDLIKQKDVLAIIGSSGTGTTMQMVDLCDQAQVPLMACAAGVKVTVNDAGQTRKWVFRTPPTDTMAVEKVINYLKLGLKVNKIAILYDSNPFGSSGNELFKKMAPAQGIQIVSDQSYETNATDMTPQLNKVKGTDAQALVVWGTNPGPATIAKNAKALGMTIPYVGSHGIANKNFIKLAGDAANGAVFPAGRMLIPQSIPANTAWRKAVDTFKADFKKETGNEADTFAAHGYDAGNLIVNALKTSGADRSKLRDQLEKTTKFVGIDGIYNYSAKDHNGLKPADLIMIKVENGEWKYFKYQGEPVN